MIDFNNLSIHKCAVEKVESVHKHRYIIGCDPFATEEDEKGTITTYVIYDKAAMRYTTIYKSRKTFDVAAAFLMKNQIESMFKLSTKFINPNGTGKTIDQIRNENKTRV